MQLVEIIDALAARVLAGETEEQAVAALAGFLAVELGPGARRDLARHLSDTQQEFHEWLAIERVRLRAGSC